MDIQDFSNMFQLSEEKRQFLEYLLKEEGIEPTQTQKISCRENLDEWPLSFAQQRLWFLDQLEPGSPVYNLPIALRIAGPLDAGILVQSLDEILQRHETLRATFPAVDGQPVQIISPPKPPTLRRIDLQDLPVNEREAEALRLATEEARQPFDLAQGPLFRAKLLRLAEEEHILLLTIHHIVSDGWSFNVLMRELEALYTAFSIGQPSPLPPLPIQYADFAHWQRQWLQGEVLETQLAYWKQQLAGALPVLELPTDRPRPAVQTFRGARQSLRLPASLIQPLNALSQQEDVTLFMTLLAAFQTLLYRYTGQEDILVGSPIAGRTWTELEGLIGFFVNTLVLRTDLSGNPSFQQLLHRVREVTLGAYAHQDLPFEKLVEELQPQRDISRNPLFQVMFLLNVPEQPPHLPGLHVTPLDLPNGTAMFDVALSLTEDPQGLTACLEYNTDLFDPPTITRLLRHFQTLLEGMVANPHQSLATLPMLTPAERHQLLVTWNATSCDYPKDQGVHQLLEAQVQRTPEAVAVVFEDQQLTYRDLNARANQLAHYLRKQGVGPEKLVGICVERSLEMVVGVLGILKAGGAYVPLDPEYPPERLAFMVEDAQIQILLTQQRLEARLPGQQVRRIYLDADWQEIARESEENPRSGVGGEALAYVIYTSGSTGKPKGVQIPHRGVVNFLQAMSREPGLTAEDVLLSVTTLSFDIAALELYLPLKVGARLVVVRRSVAADGGELVKALSRWKATVMQATPATWRLLLEGGWTGSPGLKILCGGEALSRDLAEELLKRGSSVWNLYGPTETTIWSTVYRVEAKAGTIPIGRPIANTQVYVLDAWMQPVPVGVPGELYIGGEGVARGYLNRAELTAEKFLANPFGEPGGRMYRTGDVGRYLGEGNIEFLGRMDHQVKLRGYRIELGEIEAVLRQYPGVREAVVVVREDKPGEKRLVAYYVGEGVGTVRELQGFLRKKLPEYMVPGGFERLTSLPLTPNKKVDRRALPAPQQVRLDVEKTSVAPRDTLELQLIKIWEKILDVRPIGVRDNFFELGGHSLLAVRLFAHIKKLTGKNLPLATLFQAPTVEQLANILREKGWTAPWSSLVAIQPGGSKPPFFCVHAIGGNVLTYRDLAYHLGPDQPVYGLQAQGLDGKQPYYTCVEDMAAHYVKEIRTLQPEGPYFLGGSSAGGMVAFEMAQQLHAQGQQVALLALFDTYGPGYPKPLPTASSFRRKLYRFIQRLDLHLRNLFLLEPEKRTVYTLSKLRILKKRIRKKVKRNIKDMTVGSFPGIKYFLPRSLREVAQANRQALSSYVPQAYPGRITLFRASKQPKGCYPDPELGWSGLAAGGLEIHEVPGYHGAIVEEPCVRALVKQLKVCLQKAQSAEPIEQRLASLVYFLLSFTLQILLPC